MVTFKVQADRIQSNNEGNEAWVAVKISAEMKSPPANPTQADVDALLPWKWQDLAGGADWTPHSRDAWAVWLIDPAAPNMATLIPSASIEIRSLDLRDASLETRLNAAVTAIASPNGTIRSESLVLPDGSKEADPLGTVPGFVERLASVPHPVPSTAQVHALLAIIDIQQRGTVDGYWFIAAPRVTPSAGQAFDAAALPPTYVGPSQNNENFYWTLAVGGNDAELKASRKVSDMKANAASGRVIDLFAQTVAVNSNPMHTLPTAEALATLPQALADAMDPLARLQSVLTEGLRAWIDGGVGREQLVREDLGLTGLNPPPLKLKRMLDGIAIQVLGTRYDAVGRFEVPLVEALERRKDEASEKLLKGHIAAMPVFANGSECLAAWRTVPAAVFGPTPLPQLGIADASPFTLDRLREQAGFDTGTSGIETKNDVDVLRLIWSHPARVEPDQVNHFRSIRTFELPPEQPHGSVPLQLIQRVRDNPEPGKGDETGDIFADVSFDRARASAALAYAAPFIEGLVSGRTDWSTALPGNVTLPLFQRFDRSLRALLLGNGRIEGLYRTLAAQAAADAGVSVVPPSPLYDLIVYLLEQAAEEAIGLGRALGPRVDPFQTITQLPLPLSFQIDQLQTFSRHIDDWTRLSGYSLLARRTGAADATTYVSLNAATMYFGLQKPPALTHHPRYLAELALNEERDTVQGVAADGTPRSFVDPHPFAPGDQVGVSDAIAEYANKWQTAPMPGQAVLGQEGGAIGVEAARFLYGPPDRQTAKLPTLSFGRSYDLRAHLVAQGGVLAPFSRDPNNPYVLRPDIPDDPALRTRVDYRRTVPVSGPSFATDAPPAPASINLLADELPKRQPRRRLSAVKMRMNHDPATGLPRAACAPGPGGGLRFVFVVDSGGAAPIDLNIEALDQGDVLLAINLPGAVQGQWYQVDVFRSGAVLISTRAVGRGTEDELRLPANWTQVTTAVLPYQPDAVSLRLTSAAANVDVEPLLVALIAEAGGIVSELAESNDPQATRAAVLLLDGLDPPTARGDERVSNGLVRSSASVEVRGPSLDRHSWERWVNCALFSGGASSALKDQVAKTLNRLQSEDAESRTDLADPAVSGLWLELWEVFPTRAPIGAPLSFFADRAKPLDRPRVRLDVAVGAPSASFASGGTGQATVRCVAGHVYEIRARAIIRSQDMPFDGTTPNRARFGSAVLDGFSETTVAGQALLLGPVALLPIEVATADLPDLKNDHWLPDSVVPLRWEGNRRLVDLKFPASLFADADGGRRKLRYCISASLVPQHWTWRGRPVPQGEDLQFERAFAGRRDNDYGSLDTGLLRVGHALALEPGSVSAPPTIATRDLDWRGGWNLWRFGVQLTSRYRDLFQPRARDRAVRELHWDKEKKEYSWLHRDVPDAANGRAVAKPPLILMLPLTESGSDDGIVPPLLALIAEPMHANGHFGDGVAVAVEVARHPYPAFQRDRAATNLAPEKKLKYLPEVGPDPIRSGIAHPGDAIALRLDGPIGYGFDLGSEAGRFTHSGYLVSPVRHKLAPWSMIKLKMRRLERSGPATPGQVETGPLAVRSAPSGPEGAMPFEGLVIRPRFTPGTAFDIAFFREGGLAEGPAGQRIELVVSNNGNTWSVQAWVLKVNPAFASDWMSADGTANAGSFSFKRGPNEPRIRLIVSARARPERDKVWTPSGEVMVQVHMGDGEVEENGNGWVTLFTLPIEADYLAPTSSDPRVILSVPGVVERVRLSDFSPSIWCQFTVASSKVRLERDGAAVPGTEPDTVRVETLDLKLPKGTTDPNWTKLVLHDGDRPRRMVPDVDPEPNIDAEMIEVRVALFTEDAFDISHQVRERPVIAVRLGDVVLEAKTVTGVKSILWRDDPASQPTRSGRWRLLRVLRRIDEEIASLEDLFFEPLDSIVEDPEDARGMILTVSHPFPARAN